VTARILPLGCDFLFPYIEPHGHFTNEPRDADLVLAANNTTPGYLRTLEDARALGIPIAWWTIEDPNWFESFIEQAALADVVFTSDEACIGRYRERLGHDRVFWLPLACAPEFHHPEPLAPDAAEFVVSANWYENEARQWSIETVVEPLRRAGRSLALFSYRTFPWPAPYATHWRGDAHYRTVAEQYRYGRVVLGVNNQRTGLDGRTRTVMTSMRTFEALACGKPFLAAHSDAYTRLGLVHGEHLAAVRTPEQTLEWADRLLGAEGERIASGGRQYVLEHHTYARRLQAILKVVGRRAAHATDVDASRTTPPYDDEVERMETRLEQIADDESVRQRVLSLAREHHNPNMRYPELLALAGAMLSFDWSAARLVCEIGTFYGVTAAFLGRLADLADLPCHVLSVDSFESPYLADLPERAAPCYGTLAAHRLVARRNSVVPLRSSTAAAYMPSGIGLLLVDGGHDYATCLEDLKAYVPKLAPGGVVAVDDVWYDSVRSACADFPWSAHDCTLEVALEKIEIYRRRLQ
jgi:predicted O-methyltransferase YrrM